MSDPQQLMQDPEFQKLSPDDQIGVLSRMDPDFAVLPDQDKQGVIAHLRSQVQAVQQSQPSQPTMSDSDLAAIRAANDARPWWRKILGIAPDESTLSPETRQVVQQN
jgi:hypothetical protein